MITIGESPDQSKPSRQVGSESCGLRGNATVRSVDNEWLGSAIESRNGFIAEAELTHPPAKAVCESSLSQKTALRRGLRADHGYTAIIGTQEVRQTPSSWLSMGPDGER